MQLALFPAAAPPATGNPQPARRLYTMADWRATKEHYTHGWVRGPEMARRLGVSYGAFRKFIIRNPALAKRQQPS